MKINVAHILVPTLKEASELLVKLQTGEDFGVLARQHSKCPSGASDAGNLGFFGPGQMVKPFEDAAYATSVGNISLPVQTQFGYHLIKRLY